MILSDRELRPLMKTLVGHEDESFLNPASIDIRIGSSVMVEKESGGFKKLDISEFSCSLLPGAFALVSTFEILTVPNGYALELRLKSSRAREGFDHSLAFWFDPGWVGIGTLELKNITQFQHLLLIMGRRIGQVIVHKLTSDAVKPYNGKYQGATTVEGSK